MSDQPPVAPSLLDASLAAAGDSIGVCGVAGVSRLGVVSRFLRSSSCRAFFFARSASFQASSKFLEVLGNASPVPPQLLVRMPPGSHAGNGMSESFPDAAATSAWNCPVRQSGQWRVTALADLRGFA